MLDATSAPNVLAPKTLEDLEHAIARYRTMDLTETTGSELLRLWELIRDRSLQTAGFETAADGVRVEHSY